MRDYLFLLAAALLMLTSPVYGQEETAESKQESTEAVEEKQEETEQAIKLAETIKKWDEAQVALNKKSMAMQKEMAKATPDEIMAAQVGLQKEMMTQMQEFGEPIIEIARQAEQDPKTSLAAVEWLLQSPDTNHHKVAGEVIVKHHANNEMLPGMLSATIMPNQYTFNIFKDVIATSENRTIKGQVTLAQISFLNEAQQLAPMVAANPQFAEIYPDMSAFLKSEMIQELDSDVMLAKMKALAENYGDVAIGDSTIGDEVGREVKVLEVRSRVAIGKVAPDIEGPDIDGESFKLSDYRGKVVLLDFWGDW